MGDDRFWIRGEHYINLDPFRGCDNFPHLLDRHPCNPHDRTFNPRSNRPDSKYDRHPMQQEPEVS